MIARTAIFLLLASTAALAGPDYDINGRPKICSAKDEQGHVLMSPEQLLRCISWIARVRQPHDAQTCCGQADAFEANGFESKGSSLYAVISRDYPSSMKLYPNGLKTGDRVPIPPDKINDALRDGNPTGKGIVFLNSAGTVLCYFYPGGQ